MIRVWKTVIITGCDMVWGECAISMCYDVIIVWKRMNKV